MGTVTALRPQLSSRVLRRFKDEEIGRPKYLTQEQIESSLKASRKPMRGRADRIIPRNYLMILMGYRHALRISEISKLRWSQIDMEAGTIYVQRSKHGKSATHPLQGETIRWLRKWQRLQVPTSPFVFTSQSGGPITVKGINRVMVTLGQQAKLPFPMHAHMLRHSFGYYAINNGENTRTIQDYMGHRSIMSTAIYTELCP